MSVKLSICIATYNRVETLKMLIISLLKNKSNDFDIIINDNCSTDGTYDEIKKIKDSRIKIYKNKSPMPGLNNMLECLYKADGKYAFYCNDRDIIFPEYIDYIIKVVEKEDFGFIHFKRSGKHRIVKTKVYDAGCDSYLHQDYTHHPSGCTFNVDKMKNNNSREYYFDYLSTQYPIDYMIRDIIKTSKSAIDFKGVWKENSAEFKKKNVSGATVGKVNFFDPECILENCEKTLEQVYSYENSILNEEEKRKIYGRIIRYYEKQLVWYKQYLSNEAECIHYSREKRYVSCFEMFKIHKSFAEKINAFFSTKKYAFKVDNFRGILIILKRCIIVDIRNVFKLW